MEKENLLRLRLEGWTYQAIAEEIGLSRQRIQQLLSPPAAVRKIVVKRAKGKCQICDIGVGASGHVHHTGGDGDNYNDVDNLQLLCPSCHRAQHKPFSGLKSIEEVLELLKTNPPQRIEIKELRKRLGLSQDAFAAKLGIAPYTVRRWESGRTKPSPMARKLLEEITKGG